MEPDRPIRWGILATGRVAAKFVADLRLLPDAEVVAVGSRSQAAAEAFAQRHAIPRAYGNWAQLAADPDLDVVYVATPHSAHHAAAKQCLAAGRAVLCEKPLTLDAATAQDLVDTARSAGRFLMEGMWTRCNPTIRKLAELAGDGAIGEVTAVHADFGVAMPPPAADRLRDPARGGGALLDLGIYPVTLAHLLLGRPDQLAAWAALSPEGVDQNTGLLFGYASGALAALSCGFVGSGRTGATVSGQAGRMELPAPFFCPDRLTLHRPGAEPEVLVEPLAGNGFVPEATEVHRCLRAGLLESPLIPHATTLEVMALLDEIRARIGVSYPTPVTSP
jgi:predicted dehydrogenase